MTIEQITTEVNKVLEKNHSSLKINNKNINSNLKDLGLNSLDMLEMIVQVEEQLKISLPDEKLIEIKTPSDLLNLIQSTIK
ncbi:acyl carrier protein [Malacoplasma penetrans HF-2]|uniref:Acyl carrier protein n=1 Tax=Malacoplasma penetrans (strain HF-2) TaxID=272633 RepID=Q8EVZ1_MALP2|nr:acyl carrier protein [Malacoplasma penetrans]BAC44206.1 acyl carrier protein [Malacoplasma penetrans HF-2]